MLAKESFTQILQAIQRWASRLRMFRIYAKSNGSLLAKGLAFSLLFGSIPLLFLLVSLRSIIFFPVFMSLIEEQILAFLPPDIRQVVFELVVGGATRFSFPDVLTVLVFLYAVNTLFSDLGTGMATMLNAPPGRGWLHRIFAIPLMAAFIVLFYAASVIAPGWALLQQMFVIPSGISWIVPRIISTGVYTLILTGLFRLFSGRKLRFLPTLFIAFGGSVVWQGFVFLGSQIIFGLGSRLLILGAVATVMVVLFYMRFLADIFLFSAVLVRIYSTPHGIAEQKADEEQPHTLRRVGRFLAAGMEEEDDDMETGHAENTEQVEQVEQAVVQNQDFPPKVK